MKKTKTQKGITLIALIITIIVLLILAVVTINSLQEGGIVTHAENATSSYKQAQADEEASLYAMQYYLNNKRNISEASKEKISELCKATGVTANQLTVHYNKFDGSEYVLYRIDKTTEAERTTLEGFKNEELGIDGVKPLIGDADRDGILTLNDAKLIEESGGDYKINGEDIIDENGDFKEEYLDLFDINSDGAIDSGDSGMIEEIVYGEQDWSIYTGGYMG